MKTIVAACALPATMDLPTNIASHVRFIDEAADQGASLVVFPETSVTGYPQVASTVDHDLRYRELTRVAERVPDGPSVTALAAEARRRGIHVVFGVVEQGERPWLVYNTLVLCGPEGYLGSYRKVHLTTGERAYWRPGDDWPVIETPMGRIGMQICHDKMFPESSRELMLRGADILVIGSAWSTLPVPPVDGIDVWLEHHQLFDRARAAENARWVISANLVGESGGWSFPGVSAIVSPTGEVIARTPEGRPGLAVAEVDVWGGVTDAMALIPGPFLLRDRRPETYAVLSGESRPSVDG